ncbi:MAG: DUF2141 domain-containing protein [Maribacter sp.]
MKIAALILGLVFTGLVATAQDKEGATITVTIENVLSSEGKIIGSLHTGTTFMKAPGIENEVVEALEGEVTLTFTNVEPGTFAIMLLHDTNNNNRMDFEANGMPKESYATTGELVFGPPSFASSKFEVTDKDLDFRVRF